MLTSYAASHYLQTNLPRVSPAIVLRRLPLHPTLTSYAFLPLRRRPLPPALTCYAASAGEIRVLFVGGKPIEIVHKKPKEGGLRYCTTARDCGQHEDKAVSSLLLRVRFR